MIVAVFPVEFHRLGHEVLADLVVDVGLMGLAELVTSSHIVPLPVLDEVGTGLMESERDAMGDTLCSEGKNPVVVAGAGIDPRLAPDRHLLDGFIQIRRDVHGGDQRRCDDALVLDGKRPEDGQPVIGHLLILHRAPYDDIVIAVAPVVGHAFQETVDAFGEKVELEVAPPPDHFPAFRPPGIGIFQQEIGCKTGEHQLPALDLPGFVALSLDREIEIARLPALAARYLAAVHLILPVDIAVFAPGADLGATVPRVPVGVYLPVFGHSNIDLPMSR